MLWEDVFFVICWGGNQFKPSEVSERQFLLLMEVSSIHSKRVFMALKEYLLDGYTRKDVCKRNNISQGYFSVSLSRIQRVNSIINLLVPYYLTSQS